MVRRTRNPVIASVAKQSILSFFAWRDGLLRYARNDGGWIRLRHLAARCARSFARKPYPRKSEGAGKAGYTLYPRSRAHDAQEDAHASIQVQRRHSDFPCAMALRLTSCSPRRTGFVVTVIREKRWLPANLMPASRHQVHTTSPYATARSSCVLPRPSLPAPTSATMANAPLTGRDGGICKREST
jgi:hypothetical protein